MAVDPDVAVAVPAVIAVNPNPSRMRWTVVEFDDGRGRRHAHYNSDLRKSGGRNETDSKQQRQRSFFHGKFVLHGIYPLRRIGKSFQAILFVNTRARDWLRSAVRAAPRVDSERLDAEFLCGLVQGRRLFLAGRKHVAQALDLGAHTAQLILNVLVAAVHVVDAIDD